MTNAEIQVGEYVRTQSSGFIGKVENINEFREPECKYAIDTGTRDLWFIGEEIIKSHSSNIIDLIEAGDYVNGNKVVDVGGAWKDNLETITIIEVENIGEIVNSADIKTIVTKEQFEAMEYKVGGEDEQM